MRASADRIVDDQSSAEAINKQLLALDQGAFKVGSALGSGFAYPVTFNPISRWAQILPAHGLQLAPTSALMNKR